MVKSVRELFNYYDRDGDNNIDTNEFNEIIAKFGLDKIANCVPKYYTYDDLVDYLKYNYKMEYVDVTTFKFHLNKLGLCDQDINFVMSNMCTNGDSKLRYSDIVSYINKFE